LFILLQGIITIATIIITIAIAIAYVLPTTTAIGGTLFNARPPPHQGGATLCHNCDLAAAGQHHALSATGEQSEDCKTSSFQWEDGEGERIC